jgi:hypothetical protein
MKEISGVFADKKSLDRAIEKIVEFGVKKENISLLAREEKIKKSLSGDYSHVLELRNKKDIPRIRYISEKSLFKMEENFLGIVSIVGVIAAIIIGILFHKPVLFDVILAFISGYFMMMIGILISGIIRKRHCDYLEKKLDKGGLLFWIDVEDEDEVRSICKSLRQNSASYVRTRRI